MASSSHTNHNPAITYDVFLSFRGEDTRHTFTDHLYHALVRAGLSTFRDNDEIDRGQELKPEIETAIIGSGASIVVLSENYADSRWCMDELCLILEQRRKCGHFVLPIFYHVDPSDVRNQRRSFAIEGSNQVVNLMTGFSKCLACLGMDAKDESIWMQEFNAGRWKTALTEVANMAGMELTGSRSERNFIGEVIETIQSKLDLKELSIPAHLTGMETRVEVINSWLKNEQSNAIAICGMGGSGKTTLAKCIYNLNKQNFESSSFVEEIGKHYKHGLLGLQKQLLKDISYGKEILISGVSEGTYKIEEVLQKKKVLIILDDIDDHDELSSLLGTKTFHTHIKIIITTRHLDIQSWFGSKSWRCWLYRIKLLDDLESLELLSWHAFGSKIPIESFEEHALELAQYCEGNPLALKVLGSSLFVRDEDPQTINSMMKVWRSRINSLNSLKGNIDYKIQGVLRKSFDSLPQPSERELFLHIACFFVGEHVTIVELILKDELYAESGILTLINRSLLTISPNSKLMMHQLLQELGRNVVYEESKDAGKRSRVWHDTESYCVLRKGGGSDTIEGLSLDIRKVDQEMTSEVLELETSSFANMDRLKLLQLKYVTLVGPYEKFPKLIWLCWHGCPLNTIPPGLLMTSLVVIELQYGHMEMFEVPTVLNSLKSLYLKGCDKLVSICNLGRLPNLEYFSLWNCSSLIYLCKSIGDLECPIELDLTGCTKLWKYINQSETTMLLEQHWLPLPRSLTWLDLSNCGLEFNNDVCMVFHAQSSFDLHLAANPFVYLPNTIDLKMIRILNLYSCSNLKSLPCIPSTLKELYIDWCTSLERVTFQSGRFSLQGFAYECCFKLFEVQGLLKLVPVEKIDEADLGDMQWIKAYEDHSVELIGDDITKGRIWYTQMLYEYGIMSTYLQGVKNQSMPTYQFTSSSCFLSFRVPFHHEKNKIRGLHVSCLYRSLVFDNKDIWTLLLKISNKSKGVTWVYNPMVYCKPKVDVDVVWLSYWPIGNLLDYCDEVSVGIYVDHQMIVSECGANLVYIDEGEEKHGENSNMKEEQMIGGDLSEFEVTTGGYYLCRRDLHGSNTSTYLKQLFGDNVYYTDSQGWKKTHQSVQSRKQRDFTNTFMKIIELGFSIINKSEIGKIEKVVSSLVGVKSVSADKETRRLIVTGHVDPIEVATCITELNNVMVEIISVESIFD